MHQNVITIFIMNLAVQKWLSSMIPAMSTHRIYRICVYIYVYVYTYLLFGHMDYYDYSIDGAPFQIMLFRPVKVRVGSRTISLRDPATCEFGV